MKKLLEIRQSILGAIIVCILSFFAQSCMKDNLAIDDDVIPQGDSNVTPPEGTVALRLNIVASTDVAISRSALADEENAIKRASLYLFSEDNYHSHEEIPLSSIDASTPASPRIYSKILAGIVPPNTTVVLILNHKKSEPVADPVTIKHSTIETHFTLGGVAASGFENLDSGIPMYGEVLNWTTTTTDPILITRSVAKVLVQLKDGMILGSYGSSAGFTTANVKYGIFNHAVSGKFVSGHSDANTAPFSATLSDDAITKSTILSPTTYGAGSTSYIYEYPYATRIIGTSATSDIPNTSTTYNKDRLAIILKVDNVGSARFYRLDLARQGDLKDEATYVNIVRNHQYRVLISEVNDSGYATADAAIKGYPNNVVFTISDDTGGDYIMSHSNKYAMVIGKELPTTGITYLVTNFGVTSIPVATGVGHILNSGVALPSPNVIEVVDANAGNAVVGHASITPSELSSNLNNLKIDVSSSAIAKTQHLKYRIKLGVLEYLSEVYHTIVWVAEQAIDFISMTSTTSSSGSVGVFATVTSGIDENKKIFNNQPVSVGGGSHKKWPIDGKGIQFFAYYPRQESGTTYVADSYPTVTYTPSLTTDFKIASKNMSAPADVDLSFVSKLTKLTVNAKVSKGGGATISKVELLGVKKSEGTGTFGATDGSFSWNTPDASPVNYTIAENKVPTSENSAMGSIYVLPQKGSAASPSIKVTYSTLPATSANREMAQNIVLNDFTAGAENVYDFDIVAYLAIHFNKIEYTDGNKTNSATIVGYDQKAKTKTIGPIEAASNSLSTTTNVLIPWPNDNNIQFFGVRPTYGISTPPDGDPHFEVNLNAVSPRSEIWAGSSSADHRYDYNSRPSLSMRKQLVTVEVYVRNSGFGDTTPKLNSVTMTVKRSKGICTFLPDPGLTSWATNGVDSDHVYIPNDGGSGLANGGDILTNPTHIGTLMVLPQDNASDAPTYAISVKTWESDVDATVVNVDEVTKDKYTSGSVVKVYAEVLVPKALCVGGTLINGRCWVRNNRGRVATWAELEADYPSIPQKWCTMSTSSEVSDWTEWGDCVHKYNTRWRKWRSRTLSHSFNCGKEEDEWVWLGPADGVHTKCKGEAFWEYEHRYMENYWTIRDE